MPRRNFGPGGPGGPGPGPGAELAELALGSEPSAVPTGQSPSPSPPRRSQKRRLGSAALLPGLEATCGAHADRMRLALCLCS